jgi:LPS sulfotransferase NodH
VILTTGRTGSEHLVALLDSHPGISCGTELFHPHGSGYAQSDLTDPFAYLEGHLAELPGPVRGFKLTYQDLYHLPALLELLHDPSLKVLYLRRANLLAQVTSTEFAVRTKRYHSTVGPHELAQVHLDPDKLLQTMYELFVRNTFLAEFCRSSPVLDVEYENLNDPATHTEIELFLGVAEAPLTSQYAKLVGRPLTEAIENVAEVRAALAGTVWEGFLTDGA